MERYPRKPLPLCYKRASRDRPMPTFEPRLANHGLQQPPARQACSLGSLQPVTAKNQLKLCGTGKKSKGLMPLRTDQYL